MSVPPPLEAICLKAMAKLPDNRYQTAAEMHDDLQRFLNGQPVSDFELGQPGFGLPAANVLQGAR